LFGGADEGGAAHELCVRNQVFWCDAMGLGARRTHADAAAGLAEGFNKFATGGKLFGTSPLAAPRRARFTAASNGWTSTSPPVASALFASTIGADTRSASPASKWVIANRSALPCASLIGESSVERIAGRVLAATSEPLHLYAMTFTPITPYLRAVLSLLVPRKLSKVSRNATSRNPAAAIT
jgi:hypothetical protein